MKQAHVSREPIRIIDAANDSLVLGNRAGCWAEPWSAVQKVTLARVPFGNANVFIAMLSVDGIEGERTVTISDADPDWQQVLRKLPRVLVGVEPFEVWSRRPDIGARAVVIYDRSGGR